MSDSEYYTSKYKPMRSEVAVQYSLDTLPQLAGHMNIQNVVKCYGVKLCWDGSQIEFCLLWFRLIDEVYNNHIL